MANAQGARMKERFARLYVRLSQPIDRDQGTRSSTTIQAWVCGVVRARVPMGKSTWQAI